MKPSPDISDVQAQRFMSNVAKAGAHDCWLWRGGNEDRPTFRLGRVTYACAQVALWLVGAVRGPGEGALHSCDNPRCCNPRHLRWGTQADNMADKRKRGRVVNGHGPARAVAMRRWLDNWTAF